MPSAPRRSNQCALGPFGEDRLEALGELVAVRTRGRVVGEPRVRHQLVQPQHARSTVPTGPPSRRPPARSSRRPCGTRRTARTWASGAEQAAAPRPTRSSSRRACRGSPARTPAATRTPPALAGPQPFDVGGEQSERAAEPRPDVQHRRPDLDRARRRRPGDAHDAALGLQDQVEPTPGGLGPDVAVARDRAVHDARVARVHASQSRPCRARLPGPRVLDDEVVPRRAAAPARRRRPARGSPWPGCACPSSGTGTGPTRRPPAPCPAPGRGRPRAGPPPSRPRPRAPPAPWWPGRRPRSG